jgi:hypothetical protein
LSEPLHCENHPNVETYLRCNRCAKPICTRCAVRTPVGYRCKECLRSQQRVYYDEFGLTQYAITVAVALPLALLAGWLVPRLGWFTVFLGPLTGTAISRAVRWAVRRKRGEHTWLVVCSVIAVGGALPIISRVIIPLVLGSGAVGSALGGLLSLLWAGVYLVTAIGSAYAWLRPGRRR